MRACVLVLTCALALSPITHAQTSVDQILSSAGGKTENLLELAALFQHEDPAVRLLAFDTLSESTDPSERRLAYEQALISADTELRAQAIYKKLALANPLVITLYSSEGMSERAQKVFGGNARIFVSLEQLAADVQTRRLVVSTNSRWQSASQVAGDRLRLFSEIWFGSGNAAECTGDLILEDARNLRGTIYCTESYGSLSAEITLVE